MLDAAERASKEDAMEAMLDAAELANKVDEAASAAAASEPEFVLWQGRLPPGASMLPPRIWPDLHNL